MWDVVGGAPRRRRPRWDGAFRAHGELDLLHRGLRRLRDHGAVGRHRDPVRTPGREARSANASLGSTPGGTGHRSASTTRRSPTTRPVSCQRSTAPGAGSSTTRCSPPTTSPLLHANMAPRSASTRPSWRSTTRRSGARSDAGGRRRRRGTGRRQRGRPALESHQPDGRRDRRHAHRQSSAAQRGVRGAGTDGLRARRRRHDRCRPRHRPVLPPAVRRHAAGRRYRAGVRRVGMDRRPRQFPGTADGRGVGDDDVPPRQADAGVRRAEPTRRAGRPVRRGRWLRVPIYDKSSLDGFYMACGTSGNQFKNAPLAGQFIRAIVDAAERGSTTTSSRCSSSASRTGRAINVGSAHDVATRRSRPAR